MQCLKSGQDLLAHSDLHIKPLEILKFYFFNSFGLLKFLFLNSLQAIGKARSDKKKMQKIDAKPSAKINSTLYIVNI